MKQCVKSLLAVSIALVIISQSYFELVESQEIKILGGDVNDVHNLVSDIKVVSAIERAD